MFYAILSEDVSNSLEKRLTARPAHLARLEELKADGRLLVAGPHPAMPSSSAARALATSSRDIWAGRLVMSSTFMGLSLALKPAPCQARP